MHASSRPFRLLAATLAIATTLAACQTAEQPEAGPAPNDAERAAASPSTAPSEDGSQGSPVDGLVAGPGEVAARATVIGADQFAIVDHRRELVRMPFNGELLRVTVGDGDQVRAGEEIALVATDRDVDRFQPSLEAEIEGLERELELAERRLTDARRTLDDLRLRDSEQRVFPDEFETREQERRALIGAYLADLEAGRAVQLAPSRDGVIELLEEVLEEQRRFEDALFRERVEVRAVARARVALEEVRAQRGERSIVAPFDGVFRLQENFDFGLDLRRTVESGDFLNRGTTIGTVTAVDDLAVTVLVPETAIDDFETGGSVHIEFAARPGIDVRGTIVGPRVGEEMSETRFLRGPDVFRFDGTTGALRRDDVIPDQGFQAGPARTVFRLEIELDDDAPSLRSGMSGLARPASGAVSLEVSLEVAETDVHRVEPGQSVRVTLRAFPDVPLEGQVLSVGRIPALADGDVTYAVRVAVPTDDGDHGVLRSGLTGTALITVGTG